MDRYEALEKQLLAVTLLMEDIYQSGFDSVHDSTLEELKKIAQSAPEYGLIWLGEQIEQLHALLFMRRHRTEKQQDAAANIFVNINAYLYLCLQKAAYDKCEATLS